MPVDDSVPFLPFGEDTQSPALKARLRAQAQGPDPLNDVQEEIAEGIAITLGLGRIRAAIPGRAGRVFEEVFSATGVSPTGAPTFGPKVGANFAPAPFGYTDPAAVRLPPNFFLPAGATNFIPAQLDALGFGLPEQRREDAAAAAARAQTVREDAAEFGRAAWADYITSNEPPQPQPNRFALAEDLVPGEPLPPVPPVIRGLLDLATLATSAATGLQPVRFVSDVPDDPADPNDLGQLARLLDANPPDP